MKTYQSKIEITLKKSVLDPQGTQLQHALSNMGYESVADVRVGKFLEVTLSAANEAEAQTKLNEMCDKLLANPVIEEYKVELIESGAAANVS